jgi:hypothetical protein
LSSHLNSPPPSKFDADPFSLWNSALENDLEGRLDHSREAFREAADQFFRFASEYPAISLACHEYSTLMDAYSRVQSCRIFLLNQDYDAGLESISQASEILRSSIHFAFLSPYEAGCASLDGLETLELTDPDRFQSCKNSIALFEQAKIVLSLRDERHPLIKHIDAYIRFAISKALEAEAAEFRKAGSFEEAISREKRSVLLMNESKQYVRRSSSAISALDYFPTDDQSRCQGGAMVLAYPREKTIDLLNVGTASATVERFGNLKIEKIIPARSSLEIPFVDLQKGQIRIVYSDNATGLSRDEGCVSLL